MLPSLYSLGWKMVATAMLMSIICQHYSMSVHSDLSNTDISSSSTILNTHYSTADIAILFPSTR
jgi:hypothetical protein